MKIWILGWGSRMGRLLIEIGKVQWDEFFLLVRNPDKYNGDPLYAWCTILHWDATNPQSIANLLQYNLDVVIHTVSVPFFHPKPTHLYSQTTQAFLTAYGNRYWDQSTIGPFFLIMSNIWTHHIRHQMSLPIRLLYEHFLGDVANDKEKEESLLATSSLNYCVLKAPKLTSWKQTWFTLTPFDNYLFSAFHTISRSTVAKALLELAQEKRKWVYVVLGTK